MRVVAIVPAAGQGKRLVRKSSKALVSLEKKPILIHTLIALSKIKDIKEIVVVVQRGDISKVENLVNKHRLSKVRKVVAGGVERAFSVKNGLRQIDKNVDLVLVHDGARPLVEKEFVSKVINEAKRFGSAILAVPVKPTIKKVNLEKKEIVRTLDRSFLWEVHTPQVFRKDIIERAYKNLSKKSKLPSDDSLLVEKLGYKVRIVKDSYRNIKITTPEDLLFAKLLLR